MIMVFLNIMASHLARAILKVIRSKEQEGKQREKKELQPVFQTQQIPDDNDNDQEHEDDDDAEQSPLQAGKHLEELPKDQGTGDDDKHRPESVGAKHEGEEAEEEEEELHERGEEGSDNLFRTRQTIGTIAISLQIPDHS